jgi:flagellar basal-body rod protein FlgF
MNDIFQIASFGMIEGKQRLEAISLNAANASLPGYRRHLSLSRTFDAALTGASSGAPTANATPASTGSRVSIHQVDLQPAARIATGRALDIAIDGDELFFALTDGTQTWLTRAGSFRIDNDGILVGERGLRVVGAQGDIRLPSSEVEVGADGRISHQGAVLAALQLFRANDRVSLQAADGTLLISPAGTEPADAGVARMRAGVLEASNTDAAREMLSVVALTRQFEGLSRVLQNYDELLGRAIQKIGEV